MWLELAVSLAKSRDRTLNNRTGRLTQLLKRSHGNSGSLRGSQFDNFAQATPEGRLIQVFDRNFHRIYPMGSDAVPFPWPKEALGSEEYLGKVQFEGHRFRVLGRKLNIDGDSVQLYLAGQLEDNRMTLSHFAAGLLWAAPLVLVVSALAGYFVSRRALNPLDRLIVSARSITIGNLSRRLPISDTGDELARLAETCNEMLERLEKAVSRITRFTADASHELRSPLAFIQTVAECALRMPNLDSEASEAFRDIVSETKEAAKLLEDMLVLARADAGHTDTIFDTVDLSEIVRDVTVRNQSVAATKNQTLSLTIDAASACITGDVTRLRRLIWILTDNAMKYTPSGGSIDISVSCRDSQIMLIVKDSGVGIPQVALPHIFERFFRVDSARSQQEGTGLGLAIAKWIADVHLAKVEVESQENLGSTFRVIFPLQVYSASDSLANS
jgi:signal transduction histidine kinase